MKVLLSILFSISAWAVTPVITPGTNTCTPNISGPVPCVAIATTMTFTANQTGTWSMVSGSDGSINSSGVYTAPASITAHNNFLGIQNKPNDHVYNTRISALPANSAMTTYWQAHTAGTTKLTLQWDYPYSHTTNASTGYSMLFNYDPAENGTYKLPDFAHIGPDGGVYDKLSEDSHLLVVNSDTGEFADIYKLYPIGNTTAGLCVTCNSQSGTKYVGNYTLPANATTAAGTEVSPLVIRYSELDNCITNGVPIKHASQMTINIGAISNTFIWPATSEVNNPGMIPWGTRFRIKSSFPISGFSAATQCLLQNGKDYGYFLADGGGDMQVGTMADAAESWEMLSAINDLQLTAAVHATDMEVIDESSLEDLDSTSPAFQSGRVNPGNGTVTPDDFATVQFCNAMSECAKMPVILQGVTIGTEQPVGYSFIAGMSAYQIPFWVNGSTNHAVTFTMSPTVGTLTAGGLYTPPATSSTRQETTITITSSADANQTLRIPIYVYPQGGIRERFSNDINTDYGPDVNGNTWFIGKGMQYRFNGEANCDWRSFGVTWTNTMDPGLFNNCGYDTVPADHYFRFIVPNGTYSVNAYYGIPTLSTGQWVEGVDSQSVIYSGSSAIDPGTNGDIYKSAYAFLGVPGRIFDICDVVVSCTSDKASSITMTSTVTDNTLYVAVRGFNRTPLTAIQIVPSGSPSALPVITGHAVLGGNVSF